MHLQLGVPVPHSQSPFIFKVCQVPNERDVTLLNKVLTSTGLWLFSHYFCRASESFLLFKSISIISGSKCGKYLVGKARNSRQQHKRQFRNCGPRRKCWQRKVNFWRRKLMQKRKLLEKMPLKIKEVKLCVDSTHYVFLYLKIGDW